MSVTLITPDEKQILFDNHQFIEAKLPKATLIGLIASFITAFALLAIAFSTFTLWLPGVDSMKHVIAPVIIPSSFALLLTIPLWVYCIYKQRAINQRLGISLIQKDGTEKPLNQENNHQTIPILQNILKTRYSQLHTEQEKIDLLKNQFFPAPPDFLYSQLYKENVLKRAIEPLTEYFKADFIEDLQTIYAKVLTGKK